MHQWRVTPRNGRATPVIATGHQPTLWHPGILAKYLAADAFAKHVGGSALNVVVEHNPLGPLGFDVPITRDRVLSVRRFNLADRLQPDNLPPNRLPPLSAEAGLQSIMLAAGRGNDRQHLLKEIGGSLGPVLKAYGLVNERTHQAAQTSAVLDQLSQPYLEQSFRSLASSTLVTQGLVDRLNADPVNCVRCYNRAVAAYPEAGVRPLYVGRDVVEAPLWAQGDGPSSPLYVEIGDSHKPHLFTEGQHIDLTGSDALQYLRPRAITLSAIMRSEFCDLFIHGTGGGVYDQVTERWWHDWTGEDLAPMAVVSADVYLPFDVPVATPAEHARTQWYAHHLPHNVDRYVSTLDSVASALSREKRALLDRMNDDRDKRRRARAFARIHAINAELRQQHAELIRAAKQQAEDARAGAANAAIASRRDWCFALYPGSVIHALRQSIAQSIQSPASSRREETP